MPFPQTIEEMKEQGYTFIEHIECRGRDCGATIEFWRTPRGKRMPFDVDKSGKVEAHWPNCPNAESFR